MYLLVNLIAKNISKWNFWKREIFRVNINKFACAHENTYEEGKSLNWDVKIEGCNLKDCLKGEEEIRNF